MSEGPQPVCINCGLPVGEPLRLNRLHNGQVCPTCRDRVLDAIPPALPSVVVEPAAEDWAVGDLREDPFGAGGPDAAG